MKRLTRPEEEAEFTAITSDSMAISGLKSTVGCRDSQCRWNAVLYQSPEPDRLHACIDARTVVLCARRHCNEPHREECSPSHSRALDEIRER